MQAISVNRAVLGFKSQKSQQNAVDQKLSLIVEKALGTNTTNPSNEEVGKAVMTTLRNKADSDLAHELDILYKGISYEGNSSLEKLRYHQNLAVSYREISDTYNKLCKDEQLQKKLGALMRKATVTLVSQDGQNS